MQAIDAVERDLDQRGKGTGRELSESVLREPEPAPTSAPARTRASVPGPTPTLTPVPVPAPSPFPVATSFTPRQGGTGMQLSSPAPAVMQRSTDDASLVQLLLDREDRRLQEIRSLESPAALAKADMKLQEIRQQAATEQDTLRREMGAKMDQMRRDQTPTPPEVAISEQQLSALQARLGAIHGAKLLSDEELHVLEDLVADYVELEASLAVAITINAAQLSETVGKLLKLVALSERMAADTAFARQVRRKYV